MSGTMFEIERALAGALLLAPERIDDVHEHIDAGDVQNPTCRWVMLAVEASEKPFDIPAVIAWLERKYPTPPCSDEVEENRAADWAHRVVELMSCVTSAARIEYHAKCIAEASRMRRLTQTCDAIKAELAGMLPTRLDESRAGVEEIEQRFYAACESRSARVDATAIGVASPAALRELEAAADREFNGLSTGIEDLDRVLLGIQPTWNLVIAARPTKGKTTLALQLALNVARAGNRALFFSLEMSTSELAKRALSNLASVPGHFVRQPKRLTPADWEALREADAELRGFPLVIADLREATPASIRATVRREARRGLSLVVIDYLQLMHERGHETRLAEVASISRKMKELSREFGVPILLLAQLNRLADIEKPRLSHLRESGTIEQDADVVMLLSDSLNPGRLVCDVAKHRHGGAGEIEFAFLPQFSRIADAGILDGGEGRAA